MAPLGRSKHTLGRSRHTCKVTPVILHGVVSRDFEKGFRQIVGAGFVPFAALRTSYDFGVLVVSIEIS